ncbi:hypothetical protein DMP23_41880 [Amycolatopsis sp. A1MSW2902]|uniref:LysR family transcriptional regulator n=1 Tax=Amycolatopsis sp. A1MSW2902 TaxID=687413 RepID=UPI00307F1C6D
MELRQVEHFLAVVRHGNFTRAAQDVHVVQSALSASIRKLEADLGAELFDRTTRRVTLTPAGEALLPLARQIAADVDSARGEVAAVTGLARGRVSIGTIQTLTVIDPTLSRTIYLTGRSANLTNPAARALLAHLLA